MIPKSPSINQVDASQLSAQVLSLPLIVELRQMKDWEARYEKIIALGKVMPPYPEEFRNDNYKVQGCQSQVWLIAKKNQDGKIQFTADSDALIVKGLLAVLLLVYSLRTSQEILALSPDFVKALGFDTNLSPSRANGLMAMIKQMKYYALALDSI